MNKNSDFDKCNFAHKKKCDYIQMKYFILTWKNVFNTLSFSPGYSMTKKYQSISRM